MADRVLSTYSFAMIMTENMQPAGVNRVVIRRLSPVPVYAGGGLGRAVYGPLPKVDTRQVARLLGRPVHVPNWVIAAAVVATVGVSASISTGFVNPTTSTNPSSEVNAPGVLVLPRHAPAFAGSSVMAEATGATASTADGQIMVLNSQIRSIDAELQGLQHQNDELRNLARQQGSELTSAQSSLASSQDVVKGQSQDIGARLAAMQQEMDSRVRDLQASLKSAGDAVNQIRKLLGMPSVTLPGS